MSVVDIDFHLFHPAELFDRYIIGRLDSGSVEPARLSLYSSSPCSDLDG